ncbi:uncharacterized protein K452DRAFT_363076 [Aplosporella prunicola CBS 121167]|uniref:Uncharacterized protein n=1 Tax=Aplosporella prunicola CBS 121167 TaxID=1176127 RepID=A0A6A6AUA8_9PEZI|nr:uncharacterized protein K452DRAFT_363076 [Aplosporella prunicola CBS 121167]KAF2135582.1 hypothetical protein K452DRAFT_363076 [Aplosporella prunicola CBS 121167]
MSVNHLFPVVCTANLPSSAIDALLTTALAGSEALIPNSEPCLAVLTSPADNPTSMPMYPSRPPTQPFTSPFIDQSPAQIAHQVGGARFFAVLDKLSAEDKTALLVKVQRDVGEGIEVNVLRITFDSVQAVLQALEVASLGFDEMMDIAKDEGGVYGAMENKGKKIGGPAPPMKLGDIPPTTPAPKT